MSTLGQAYVQIVPTAQGISGQITNLMSGEVSAAGAKSGGLFSKIFSSKVAKGAMIAGTAIAAGIGIGANALKNGIKETAAYGDNVDKLSQKIGFTTDEFQKWDYVLQRAGTDIGKMQPVMKTLSAQAASNSAAFQELGISQEDLKNMSPGELFSETITKLSSMENQTERTALASKLLGRGATELGPLLNEGSAAIEEQMEIAEKYGMIMPESAVKASAAFQDSVTTMQMTMTGLKNRMMGEFLPAATQITDGLGKMFAGDMSGVDDVAAGIEGIVAKIGEMAPVVWEAAKRLGGQLIAGIMSNAGNLGTNIGSLVSGLVPKIIEKIPDIIVAGGKLILGLAQGLISNLPTIVTTIGRVGAEIVKGLGSALWGKVKAAANGIKDKFLEPINKLRDKVRGIIDKIKGFFKFKISAPHVPLPHFSISPAGWKLKDLLKGSIPKLGIKWYAEGGVFDSPTIAGIGEAGPEAVVPLDKFWDRLEKVSTGETNIVININGATSDPREIAEEVKRSLIQETNRRRLAWQ